MLDGQVVESLLPDYSMSFQLDIDVISTKQFSNGSPYIFFQSWIHNRESGQIVFYDHGCTPR